MKRVSESNSVAEDLEKSSSSLKIDIDLLNQEISVLQESLKLK